MQFHKLSLKNIGNHSTLDCDFTGHSLFAIVGDSRVGKSTLMEGLFFALTRATHKMGRKATLGAGINTLRKMGATDASIRLTFSINSTQYCVERTGNSSSLTGGGINLQGHDEVTAKILSLLNLTVEQLRYILFLGQGNVDSFLKAKHANVTEIVVQDILNTGVLAAMHTDLNEKVEKLITEQNKRDGSLEQLREQHEKTLEKRNDLSNFPPSFFHSFQGKKDAWLSCTQNVQDRVSDLLREIAGLEEKLTKAQAQLNTATQDILPLGTLQKMEQLYQEKESILNTLKLQIYQTTQLNTQQKKELESLLSDLATQKTSIQALKDNQEEWNATQQTIQEYTTALEAEEQKLDELNQQKGALEDKFKASKNDFDQQASVVSKLETELKTLEAKISGLQSKIKQYESKIAQTEAKIKASSQQLISEQANLLDRCVQFVQVFISENDKDSCPVCEQKLPSQASKKQADDAPSAKDFSNIKKLQQELNQLQTDLNQQRGDLGSFQNQLDEKINEKENVLEKQKENKDQLAVLKDIFTSDKDVLEQFKTTLEEQNFNVGGKQKHISVLSKKKTLYSWLQSDATAIFQSLQTFLDCADKWEQITASLTAPQCIVLFQSKYVHSLETLTSSDHQRLLSEMAKNANGDTQIQAQIAQLQQQIIATREKLNRFWEQFVLQNADWSNLINPSSLDSAKWNEFKQALKLLQESRDLSADLSIKSKERSDLQDKIVRLSRIAKHFGAGNQNFREYLAAELFKELCMLSNPFLQTFLGKTCLISYNKNGFFLDQQGQTLSAKALSGGERFYVSLALAFGLREYLQKKANVTLKTIFIDEGFHMVKGAAIKELIQKLQQLSVENNIGFITHNEVLIQEAPEQLKVSQNSAVWG